MPDKNKFPLSGLSKQQKEILKTLYDNDGFESTKGLSWTIARKFDNEQDSRIEKRKSRYEIVEEMKQEYLNEDTAPERKKIIEHDLEFMRYIAPSKLDKEILSEKHRASMSRSIKRLRERGLIKGYRKIIWDWDTGIIRKRILAGSWERMRYYCLTDKGLNIIN